MNCDECRKYYGDIIDELGEDTFCEYCDKSILKDILPEEYQKQEGTK